MSALWALLLLLISKFVDIPCSFPFLTMSSSIFQVSSEYFWYIFLHYFKASRALFYDFDIVSRSNSDTYKSLLSAFSITLNLKISLSRSSLSFKNYTSSGGSSPVIKAYQDCFAPFPLVFFQFSNIYSQVFNSNCFCLSFSPNDSILVWRANVANGNN